MSGILYCEAASRAICRCRTGVSFRGDKSARPGTRDWLTHSSPRSASPMRLHFFRVGLDDPRLARSCRSDINRLPTRLGEAANWCVEILRPEHCPPWRRRSRSACRRRSAGTRTPWWPAGCTCRAIRPRPSTDGVAVTSPWPSARMADRRQLSLATNTVPSANTGEGPCRSSGISPAKSPCRPPDRRR